MMEIAMNDREIVSFVLVARGEIISNCVLQKIVEPNSNDMENLNLNPTSDFGM